MTKTRWVTDPVVSGDTLVRWALERLKDPDLNGPEDLGPYRAFGIVRDEGDRMVPLCVLIYNSFRQMSYGNDVRVIIVADHPSWCLRSMLREIFYYPFEVAGCERLTAIVRDGNKQSLKLCRGLGFVKEGVLRRAYDGKTNAIVLSMLKQECKWIKDPKAERESKNGKEIWPEATPATRSQDRNRSAGSRKQRGSKRVRASQRDQHVHANGVGNVH